MILQYILGTLAAVSLLSTLWQWLAARRFPLHRRKEPTPNPSDGGEDRGAPTPDSSKGGEQSVVRSQSVPLLGGVRGGFLPAVTLLKPLKGADEFTESCLRSWLAQEYNGETQFLFGVASVDDPASDVVRKLLAEFSQRDAQLVVCPERLGANAKVSKLAQLEPLVKHEIVVVSDADVRVPPDLLVNLIVPLRMNRPTLDPSQEGNCPPNTAPLLGGDGGGFRDTKRKSFRRNLTPSLSQSDGERVSVRTGEGNVGLVNCFYRFANPTTPAMQWEAIAVNADFWSQVLQGASFRKLDFALGAVMATRRQHLAEIGGFRALVDCLADDYQLGNRIAKRGCQIELCPVVVECWSSPMGWRDVWRHQLRWARTIRVCQPLPYFFSIISNATLWPLLWAATVTPSIIKETRGSFSLSNICLDLPLSLAMICVMAFLVMRMLAADDLQKRLAPSHSHFSNFWLVPVKDLLQAALWLGAFAGNHIEWRGERYRLRRDGTLVKE